MRIQRKQNLILKIFSSKIFIFFLVIILILLGIQAFKKSRESYQMDKITQQLKDEIISLEEKNKELANLIDYFNSTSHVEKEAKTRLNLKKLGEKVIILKEQIEGSSQEIEQRSEEERAESQSKISNLFRWFKFIFGD